MNSKQRILIHELHGKNRGPDQYSISPKVWNVIDKMKVFKVFVKS